MIVAYQTKDRAVFLYGFAKSERENINPPELATLREIATTWLNAMVASGTSTVDRVCSGKGGIGEIPCESDNLSIKGRRGQGGTVGSHSTRRAHGGQSIETI